ncbi:hypothetical protein TNCV_2296031 [Trichonephila clavipes]|nr:hypothetical protein TNCV_2296031 [Trichonephila clavipes]
MPVPPNTIRVHTEYVLVKSMGGIWTSGQKRRRTHGDQAQDILDRPVIEKTVTSYDTHAQSQLPHWLLSRQRQPPIYEPMRHPEPLQGAWLKGSWYRDVKYVCCQGHPLTDASAWSGFPHDGTGLHTGRLQRQIYIQFEQ